MNPAVVGLRELSPALGISMAWMSTPDILRYVAGSSFRARTPARTLPSIDSHDHEGARYVLDRFACSVLSRVAGVGDPFPKDPQFVDLRI